MNLNEFEYYIHACNGSAEFLILYFTAVPLRIKNVKKLHNFAVPGTLLFCWTISAVASLHLKAEILCNKKWSQTRRNSLHRSNEMPGRSVMIGP